ncbi:MAG: sodium-dependent transporter [Bacteroides sp.]|nr:sodium-dependent transporter [Bacteroides sp.]
MSEKAKFTSRMGVIAATVGSAVGLGTIWRFPAEAQSNGGGAFLLVYVICVLAIGVPVMLAEFALGRGGQSDAVGVFRRLVPGSHWQYAGWMAILASYLILMFYMVVAGWTLQYLWQSVTGELFSGLDTGNLVGAENYFHEKMNMYISSDSRPLIDTFIMIVLNMGVLILGVQKGIEKLSNILMPLLFVLLLILASVALTFPKASEGLAYFFTPDFFKITGGVVLNALGQAFFSLSLGMGILITYGAYYPNTVNLARTSTIVSSLVVVVALLMGVIIFPAVMSFGVDATQVRGTTLVFVTLPEVFMQLPGSRLWAIIFFTLLMVAALTSTISIAEVTISYIEDRWRRSRIAACMIVMLPMFVFGGLCSLSFGSLADFKILGMNLFDFLDNLTTNILLPLVAIMICVFMGWYAPKGLFRGQITNDGTVSQRIYPAILFVVRFIAPVSVLFILLSTFIKF